MKGSNLIKKTVLQFYPPLGHILCFRSLQVATERMSSAGSHCRPLTSPELVKVFTSSSTPPFTAFLLLSPLPSSCFLFSERTRRWNRVSLCLEGASDRYPLCWKEQTHLTAKSVDFETLTHIFLLLRTFLWYLKITGACGGVVVKALRSKPAGCGFDSRWCHWNFSVT